jgi:hypothetical protein
MARPACPSPINRQKALNVSLLRRALDHNDPTAAAVTVPSNVLRPKEAAPAR